MPAKITELTRGDARAWRRFVEKYSGLIRRVVGATLGRHGPATEGAAATGLIDDVCQEVFMKLIADEYRVLTAHDPARAPLETYLAVISRSVAIDALRRQRRSPAVTDRDLSDNFADLRPEHTASVENREALGAVPADLLSLRERMVLHLEFDRSMATRSIAKLLGVQAQTVRSTRHRAIEKLRRFFGAT
jgi:RNA polymerase sigma-70 factor (ECF subfamily)